MMRLHCTFRCIFFYCSLLASLTGIALSVGCGRVSDTTPAAAAAVDASLYQLTEEPDGAVGVIAARESAEDGTPLVLVGRVGGATKPWVDGRAAFTMLDASMSVVAEGESSDEAELCLGDCCAANREGCTTLVKVVDEQGRLVRVDSRDLLGLKKSDMVVVQGIAQKDQAGNFVMLAKGVFIRN